MDLVGLGEDEGEEEGEEEEELSLLGGLQRAAK